MRALVTGGSGFIGHALVARLLRDGHEVVCIERLSHSGNLNRLSEIAHPASQKAEHLDIIHHDLRSPIGDLLAHQIGDVDVVFHLAASTHVDRSIIEPTAFVLDNVLGTTHILEYAKRVNGPFIYFSTDEVFGPAAPGFRHVEWDHYNSGNPYAASKAGGEEMALAFANTYDMDVRITHTMNAFGPRQHPEKFIPMCIARIEAGQTIDIHASPDRKTPGSRYYIHIDDIAEALLLVLRKGVRSGKYNIVGEREVDNLRVVKTVGMAIGRKPRWEMVDFHSSRPGHDLRYALDGTKMEKMGFRHAKPFDEHIVDTVQWTLAHRQWLPSLSPELRKVSG